MALQLKYRAFGIGMVLALALVAYYYIDPSQYLLVPKCPVKMLTGLDCPGCGFQRALHALLHGQLREAVAFNPFLLFALPIVGLWCLVRLRIYQRQPEENVSSLVAVNRVLIFLYIAGYFLWFVIRNLM